VVKALNTINYSVMVDPAAIEGPHAVFICGDDAAAKQDVRAMLQRFGWMEEGIIDLGGIEQARGTELYVALWIRLMGALQTPTFNIRIVRPASV